MSANTQGLKAELPEDEEQQAEIVASIELIEKRQNPSKGKQFGASSASLENREEFKYTLSKLNTITANYFFYRSRLCECPKMKPYAESFYIKASVKVAVDVSKTTESVIRSVVAMSSQGKDDKIEENFNKILEAMEVKRKEL